MVNLVGLVDHTVNVQVPHPSAAAWKHPAQKPMGVARVGPPAVLLTEGQFMHTALPQ